MGMREKLIEILRVPIFLHELVDPTEAVADYLLDNDVVPVVRCKDCKHFVAPQGVPCCDNFYGLGFPNASGNDFCLYGERKDNVKK